MTSPKDSHLLQHILCVVPLSYAPSGIRSTSLGSLYIPICTCKHIAFERQSVSYNQVRPLAMSVSIWSGVLNLVCLRHTSYASLHQRLCRLPPLDNS